ncbi:MAG: hypothetical protein ACP5PX_08360, partial [Candidatus Hadarchaeum sp.]|uniref:hypothetical protein n=1 Tax=Candidatus Hadarchaeum sp. TaxID=2883567 RepID=UPI003D11FE2E
GGMKSLWWFLAQKRNLLPNKLRKAWQNNDSNIAPCEVLLGLLLYRNIHRGLVKRADKPLGGSGCFRSLRR